MAPKVIRQDEVVRAHDKGTQRADAAAASQIKVIEADDVPQQGPAQQQEFTRPPSQHQAQGNFQQPQAQTQTQPVVQEAPAGRPTPVPNIANRDLQQAVHTALGIGNLPDSMISGYALPKNPNPVDAGQTTSPISKEEQPTVPIPEQSVYPMSMSMNQDSGYEPLANIERHDDELSELEGPLDNNDEPRKADPEFGGFHPITGEEDIFSRNSFKEPDVERRGLESIFNRISWFLPLKREARFKQPSPFRSRAIADKMTDRASNMFKDIGRGFRIYGKILGMYDLDLREIGIGAQEIADVIAQNPEMLVRLIKASTNIDISVSEIQSWSLSEIAKFFNEHDVYAGTFKPPNNRGQDVQRRIIRVLLSHQRGIYLHPYMVAMYTADFDGDDMEVSLDPTVMRYTSDPMEQMIGIDGKISLDTKFLPVGPIKDDCEPGMTRAEYVRIAMFGNWSQVGNDQHMGELVDAVLKLSDTYNAGEDAQAAAWGNVFRAARAVSDSIIYEKDVIERLGGRRNARNKTMSDLCRAVVQDMRDRNYVQVLQTMDAEIVNDSMLTDVRTYDDSAILVIIREIAAGNIPNNFQDFKTMMNGFIGNVEGKNAPFRFTADVGKMMKLDPRLQIGYGEFMVKDSNEDFVVDPNNDEHMQLLFSASLKYIESSRMQKEIKQSGRSAYFTEMMRNRVIREVGFPTDARYQGNFIRFLTNFTYVYRKYSAMINQANLVWLSNMEVAADSNRGIVSPIRMKGDYPTFAELAEPFLSIYGSYSVEKMFKPLIDSGYMIDNADNKWRGSHRDGSRSIKREYEWWARKRENRLKFWIDKKYKSYNLRQFAHENTLTRGGEDAAKQIYAQIVSSEYENAGQTVPIFERNKRGEIIYANDGRTPKSYKGDMTNEELMLFTLLAIADKRTGQASTYNLKQYGIMPDDKRDEAKVTDPLQSDNSMIGMVSKILVEMDRLDKQGTVIKSNFYAGIGSREAPPEFQEHAKSLARKLADKNFILRSGDAIGSDQAFEAGAGQSSQVYLPDREKLDKNTVTGTGKVFVLDEMPIEARRLAERSVDLYHPNPRALDDYTRKLMARNYFQIYGANGEADTAFVACWTPPMADYDENEKRKTHGTDQALRMAEAMGIKVFNAADPKYKDNLDQWEADVLAAAAEAEAGNLVRLSGRDQMRWVDDLANLLSMSDPDMFNYFGMDSPAGFLKSKLARKMIEYANDPEKLGGIYTAMMYEYKMSSIKAAQERLSKAVARFDEQKMSSSQIDDLVQSVYFEIDELSASSEVWHGIIKELKAEATPGEKSVFHQMATSGYLMKNRVSGGGKYVWNGDSSKGYVSLAAPQFWQDPGEYKSLQDVIEDLDMDRNLKWSIITDVVRYWENDAELKSWEVGFQLDLGNSAAYSLGTSDKRGVLTTFREFEKAYNRWSKVSQQKLQHNIDDAYKVHGDNGGKLVQTLARLDKCPWELVVVEDEMYADALMSVLDKTYSQTEKAQQHPWTNAIYQALCFQHNGGMMNDVTRTDDRLLGITSMKSISEHDIIHLLANPEATLTVYNEHGQYAELNRNVILSSLDHPSKNLEQDIWEFLKLNPRVATAIRRHNACVLSNTDAKGYVGARMTTSETITNTTAEPDPIEHVKYLMRDHPVYAAIISMATATKGAVTRNQRERVIEVEQYFASQIYRYASVYSSQDSDLAATRLLADLGITRNSISKAMESDYDTFCDKLGLPRYQHQGGYSNNEANENAIFTYNVARQNLAAYIEQVQDSHMKLGNKIDIEKPSYLLGVDSSSVASFWDICQELGGAKTAVSTGVEGSETYNYAEWASHISAKDMFADLQAVADDIDESWNNAWTSLLNSDNTPVLLQVGADNKPFLEIDGKMYTSFKEASSASGSPQEIVVRVPEGYSVKDRSTDSFGNPVSSLSVYMVSKRSNGAEAFNLQAKKAGLDGTDSIIKMQGKYRQVKDEKNSVNGYTPMMDASFTGIREDLRRIAAERGINAAKVELAKLLLKENESLGYKDMTLANYMCLADLMLIEGEDGQVYLRSLEMLFTAIKHRIGTLIDDLDNNERTAVVNRIVNDNSLDYGVGMSKMDPLDAFDSYVPRGRAGSTNGIKLNASMFQRNFDLLEEINRTMDIDPLAPEEADRIDNVCRRQEGISDVVKRVKLTRGYSIIGYVGAEVDAEAEKKGARRNQINWTIGPSNAIVIGDGDADAETIEKVCMSAYYLGLSVIVSAKHMDDIPVKWVPDAIMCSDDGDILIPFFDMRLNGSEAEPFSGGRFNIVQAPYSRYTVVVEDSTNEFNLGDAMVQAMKNFVDRIKCVDSGSVQIKASDLFPNVFTNPEFRNCSFSVSLARGNTVANRIMSGNATIDYGVTEGARGFEQRKKDVDAAIRRYNDAWGQVDNDAIMRNGECKPGDIAGWAEIEIRNDYTGHTQYAYAPIIPFQLHGKKKGVPAQYSVDQIGTVDNDNTLFSVDWTNTTPITEHFAKFFSSSGGADKGMMSFSNAIDEQRRLEDGTLIDAYVAKQSTSSRRIGTDRRIKTMVSLITLARMHGYNFADAPGSFPENPEIRERLHNFWKNSADSDVKDGFIGAGEWKSWLSNGRSIKFHNDERLNAFLNYECRKILENGGNPTHYLANVFKDREGNEYNTHTMWEFEAMFEQSLNYEDGLLRFLNAMDNTLCPSGLDDDGQNYKFRLARDGNGLARGYDTGVLQMKVPHKNLQNIAINGHVYGADDTAYVWDTVYIGMSFFGEDYSGFSRPNIDGASNFLDAMNTRSYYGNELDEAKERFRAMWATSDLGRSPRGPNSFGLA